MSHPSRRPSCVAIALTTVLAVDLLVTWGAHVAWLRRDAPGLLHATSTGTIAVGVFSTLPYLLLAAAQVMLSPLPRVRAAFVATVVLVTAMALLGYVGAAFYYSEDQRGPLDGVEMLGIPSTSLAPPWGTSPSRGSYSSDPGEPANNEMQLTIGPGGEGMEALRATIPMAVLPACS